MRLRSLGAALATLSLTLLIPAEVKAWGGCHAGFTHVGPAGVYHAGFTHVGGPYGGFSTGHSGFYGAGGGVYHRGYSYGGYYGGGAYGGGYSYAASPYVAYPYGGYAVGGFRAGGVYRGGYTAGVYRRW